MIIPNYGGGYSNVFTNEDNAGFCQIDNTALRFLIETLKKHMVNHEKKYNF